MRLKNWSFDDALPWRADALLQSHIPLCVIDLVNHGNGEVELLGHGEVTQVPDRRHCTEAAMHETVTVSGRQQRSRLYGVDRFLRTVETDDEGFSVGRIQSFDRA